MSKSRTCLGLLALASLQLTGCGTTFIGSRVEEATDNPHHQFALRYHVPEDVVEVVVDLERTIIAKVGGSLINPQVEVFDNTVSTQAAINLQTVADTGATYLLDAQATGFSKNNTALTVTETGLLQTVNAKSTGSGGVLFDNVMKIAGTVLPLVGAATGGPINAGARLTELLAEVPQGTQDLFVTNSRFRSIAEFNLPGTVVLPLAQCTDETELFKRHLPDTLDYRFAFQHLVGKSELVTQFCDTLGLVAERRTSFRKTLQEYDALDADADLRTKATKMSALRSEYELALAAHTAARAAIAKAVEDTLRERKIGTQKAETYTQRSLLRLSDLPQGQAIGSLRVQSDNDSAAADQAIRDKINELGTPPKAQARATLSKPVVDLFNATGIIVTADLIGNRAGAGHGGANLTACSQGNKRTPCVFYRLPAPYLLSAWTIQATTSEVKDSNGNVKKINKRQLVQSESKIVDAIADTAPVHAISLRDSTFTKRDSTLAFSARGRLTGLTRDYGAAAEDASVSIASGLTTGIDTYSTTLTSLKTIRGAENQLEMQPLQQQLALAQARQSVELQPVTAQFELATKQLEALKANVALQANSQGEAQLLQAQLTGIEQALVAAQLTLAGGQWQLSNAQTMAQQTQAQAALSASTSFLAAQIAQLQNEVLLLGLQKQIADLKKQQQ